jgi:hypothetical protein
MGCSQLQQKLHRWQEEGGASCTHSSLYEPFQENKIIQPSPWPGHWNTYFAKSPAELYFIHSPKLMDVFSQSVSDLLQVRWQNNLKKREKVKHQSVRVICTEFYCKIHWGHGPHTGQLPRRSCSFWTQPFFAPVFSLIIPSRSSLQSSVVHVLPPLLPSCMFHPQMTTPKSIHV